MSRILILFAHPLLERSRIHAALVEAARSVPGVTVNDLYDRYPDYDIDIPREQELLLNHDIIVWQFPLYWYSTPPLFKQWQDLVLEHGWAYGRSGNALTGKKVFAAFSSGGGQDAYRDGGFNRFSMHDYLRPLERTAGLCRMEWWPPFWVPGAHRMEPAEVRAYATQYSTLLQSLARDLYPEGEITSLEWINALVPLTSNHSS